MKRRAFLAAVGASATTLAGCLDTVSLDPANPWFKQTLTVTYTNDAASDRELVPLVETALAYWDEHSEQYTDYDVSFTFQSDTDDADIEISLVDKIEQCGDHDDIVTGCARIRNTPLRDAAIEIENGYSDDRTLVTIKHELGHALGLGHDDEPQEIMSNDPEDRYPHYAERTAIIDTYEKGVQQYNEGAKAMRDGGSRWDDEAYGDAAIAFKDAQPAYERSVEQFREAADIAASIEFEDARDICEEAAEHTHHLERAAFFISEAAARYDDGQSQRGNRYWRDYRDHYDDAQELAIADGDTLVEAVGLQ